MIETVFRAESMAAKERFACWRDMACASHAPYDVGSEYAADFRATLRVLDLGAVHLSLFDCPPLRSHRSRRRIRQSDPEMYYLSVARRGGAGVSHADRETAIGAGEMMLSSTSRPLRGWLSTGLPERGPGERRGGGRDGGTASAGLVQLLIPRRLLPMSSEAVDRLLAVPLPGRHGVGALFSTYLTQLTADSGSYGPSDGPRLGRAAIELATAVLAHHLDDLGEAPPPEAHPAALDLRVRAFIHQHLADPRLTPAWIATAHHISTRSLHRLFQHQGTTVAAWVRRQRLERARSELADPRRRSRPIQAIAAKWGFPRPSDFTRAFRSTYGMAPSEYRHQTVAVRTVSGPDDRPAGAE